LVGMAADGEDRFCDPAPGRERAEGEEMSETLSLTFFTIEADRKPPLAFAAKKHQEAEAFFKDERVRAKLKSVRSGGVPLCDNYSILRIRMAKADERARYQERAPRSSLENLAAVFLVDVDEE
jgi:hypothetical protein